MQKFRKIGILSSGGDAPGMNAAIRAVTRRALSQGIEVVGILGGYAGLLGAADESDPDVIREKHLRPLDAHSVSNIVTRGGTSVLQPLPGVQDRGGHGKGAPRLPRAEH